MREQNKKLIELVIGGLFLKNVLGYSQDIINEKELLEQPEDTYDLYLTEKDMIIEVTEVFSSPNCKAGNKALLDRKNNKKRYLKEFIDEDKEVVHYEDKETNSIEDLVLNIKEAIKTKSSKEYIKENSKSKVLLLHYRNKISNIWEYKNGKPKTLSIEEYLSNEIRAHEYEQGPWDEIYLFPVLTQKRDITKLNEIIEYHPINILDKKEKVEYGHGKVLWNGNIINALTKG